MGLNNGGLRSGGLRNLSSIAPANFDVAISATNSPIQKGDTLVVDFSADNTGGASDTQEIRLEIDSVEEDSQAGVFLASGETTTGSLEWITDSNQTEKDYTATILSEDDTATQTVTVGSTLPNSPTAQYQYDAQLLDGFTGGETVSSWTDQRVSSVTINGQGTYRPSAINGYAAVDHDGVDDGFDSNETTLGLPVALIAVVDTSSLPSSEEDIIAPAGDNSDRLKLGASNGAWFAFGGGSVVQGSTDSSIQLVSCLSTGNDEVFLREEGTRTASVINSNSTEGVEAVSVGYEAANNRRSWTGSIGFVELHQNITESELATREQEIADYWDITL